VALAGHLRKESAGDVDDKSRSKVIELAQRRAS
jgi:hypothetical protein